MAGLEVNTAMRIQVTFERLTAPVGVADPGQVKFWLRNPTTGVTTLYTYLVDVEIVKLSVGVYYYQRIWDVPGVWRYRWAGVGTVDVETEGVIRVDPRSY